MPNLLETFRTQAPSSTAYMGDYKSSLINFAFVVVLDLFRDILVKYKQNYKPFLYEIMF